MTDVPLGNVGIRRAEPNDYPAIARLLVANELPTDGVEETLQGFLVAESRGSIVGVVGLEYRGEYGLLRSTAVDAEWRGKRIARELVNRIIADAKARGTKAVYLLTTTAEHYFPSFGFATTSRDDIPDSIRDTGEFRGACPDSATAMSLELYPRAEPATRG
jgi:amino-acid N-acetyltransferase